MKVRESTAVWYYDCCNEKIADQKRADWKWMKTKKDYLDRQLSSLQFQTHLILTLSILIFINAEILCRVETS